MTGWLLSLFCCCLCYTSEHIHSQTCAHTHTSTHFSSVLLLRLPPTARATTRTEHEHPEAQSTARRRAPYDGRIYQQKRLRNSSLANWNSHIRPIKNTHNLFSSRNISFFRSAYHHQCACNISIWCFFFCSSLLLIAALAAPSVGATLSSFGLGPSLSHRLPLRRSVAEFGKS